MKIEALQETLSKSLYIASRFASSKIQLPVLANILLKTEKSKLLISSTNLETSISIYIGAKIESEGEITVPARIFNELISNIKQGNLKINVDKEKVFVHGSGFESSILGMNSNDFPKVPSLINQNAQNMSIKLLSDSLSQVLYAVSQDETRPTLTGVLMEGNKSGITFVSTDGFRLSRKIMKSDEFKKQFKLILPKNTLVELMRLFNEGTEIQFDFNEKENQVLFAVSNYVLASRIIEGEFPDFEKIIPSGTGINIYTDKDDFLRSVKLASVFARDASNVVKLSIRNKKVEILADSSQSGSQKTVIDAKIDNSQGFDDKDFVVAFNYRFLEDFLNSVKGDEIKIGLNDPNSPAVFLDTNDKEFLHIIMPVRLQS